MTLSKFEQQELRDLQDILVKAAILDNTSDDERWRVAWRRIKELEKKQNKDPHIIGRNRQ